MKAFVAKLVALGPMGLFLLAALDSIGVPIVGGVDAVLVLIANQSPGLAYLGATAATLGSLLGSYLLFILARKGGERYLSKTAGGEKSRKFRLWFENYGLVTIFIPAMSPIPMPLKAFVACAAVMGTKPMHFLLTIFLARVPRYFFLAWLGREMGSDALGWIKAHSWQFALGLVGISAVLIFISWYAHRSVPTETDGSGPQSAPPLPQVGRSES